jgi:hypothetical protein
MPLSVRIDGGSRRHFSVMTVTPAARGAEATMANREKFCFSSCSLPPASLDFEDHVGDVSSFDSAATSRSLHIN